MNQDPSLQVIHKICTAHNFTLIKSCGVGAFKKTFHVNDGTNDFALKIIVGPTDPARLEREIKAHYACNHEAISSLFSVGSITDEGREYIYFVEEYISGGTFSERLEQSTLTLSETKVLALSISNALLHLSERNIVHRDVKPDNIMFREDGSPMLVDLGLARHLEASSLTQSWAMPGPGTPIFASPEQLCNDKHLIDWRADQFSLGITLSIGIFSMHPFSGSQDVMHVVEKIAQRESPVDTFKEQANKVNLNVLVKMVEPWPIKRYTMPEQLISAWEEVEV